MHNDAASSIDNAGSKDARQQHSHRVTHDFFFVFSQFTISVFAYMSGSLTRFTLFRVTV